MIHWHTTQDTADYSNTLLLLLIVAEVGRRESQCALRREFCTFLGIIKATSMLVSCTERTCWTGRNATPLVCKYAPMLGGWLAKNWFDLALSDSRETLNDSQYNKQNKNNMIKRKAYNKRTRKRGGGKRTRWQIQQTTQNNIQKWVSSHLSQRLGRTATSYASFPKNTIASCHMALTRNFVLKCRLHDREDRE